ncbi:MAG: hypothetical protein IJ062_06785, partial [Firmicutes bacterium]|nr:hypothetical protein [Bacillota bacterium]
VANDNLRKKIIAAVFKLELRKTLFAQYVLTHFSKKWAGCRGGAPQENLPDKFQFISNYKNRTETLTSASPIIFSSCI